jgi:hypothetical protein
VIKLFDREIVHSLVERQSAVKEERHPGNEFVGGGFVGKRGIREFACCGIVVCEDLSVPVPFEFGTNVRWERVKRGFGNRIRIATENVRVVDGEGTVASVAEYHYISGFARHLCS